MALEARLASMQAASDGVVQAKQQSEAKLQKQLDHNEKARMEFNRKCSALLMALVPKMMSGNQNWHLSARLETQH